MGCLAHQRADRSDIRDHQHEHQPTSRRSIRLDKHWPEKVANNWDVICLADEFQTGFSDYKRFIRKHKQLYGVGDDGAIEKGPGHVHPAFMDAEPMGIHEGMAMFNDEMLKRSKMRARTRDLWGIGQPFNAEPKDAVESKQKASGPGFGFPNRAFHGAMRRSQRR